MFEIQQWAASFWQQQEPLVLLYQLGTIVVAWLLAYATGRVPVKHMLIFVENYYSKWYALLLRAVSRIVIPSLAALFLLLSKGLLKTLGIDAHIVSVVLNLTLAWIVIRFCTVFIRRPAIARWLALVAWGVAALNILGWLDVLISQLDDVAISIGGDKTISLLTIVQGVVTIVVFIWGAIALSAFVESRLRRIRHLTPSLQVLLGKMIRIALIAAAFMVVLNTMGIDLTALAVFGGAVGVGIGFGLQKVVSNFISGIILLMDRSIKPGDVISIDDTYGWVNALGARYVSVITRDGREHLIPNELLITEKVENWSYSDTNVRLKIPVGISYKADVRKAMELMHKVIGGFPRLLENPEPNILLKGFGDSSVDLEVRVWVGDPQNGVSNITSDILLQIWDAFHREGIEIPFPQRDLHIKSVDKDVAKVLTGKAKYSGLT